jgi:periplasmic divalent cation tolerance protein
VKVVLVTAPVEAAKSLASRLVEERLAACVNLVPGVQSVYRWKGQVADEAETLLVVKTTDALLGALRRRVVELHPYAVPEVVALEVVDVHPAYAQWVEESVSDATQPDAR